MKRLVSLCVAILAFAWTAAYATDGATATTGPDKAQEVVQTTATALLERLQADHDALKANPERVYPLVQDLVLPHFDFGKMSQWVLGKYWRRASAQQREQFTGQFRNLLVRTYATALLQYDNQTIRYLPLQAGDDARRVTVKMEIVQSGGPPIPINYAMYQRKDGQWKVYDIAIDGASMVSTYRKSYYSQIRKQGLDALIAKLKSMNAKVGKGE
jgi:phospholipid transport system substrate-binding protein